MAMLSMLVFPQDGEFWVGMAVTVVDGLLAVTLPVSLAMVALAVILGSSGKG